MGENDNGYDASQIKVLGVMEGIRRRPGMYVGSTSERGLHQLVYEAVGRAVNEVLAGRAGSVDVTLMPDGGIRVSDDGDSDAHGLEALLTRLPAGVAPGHRRAAEISPLGVGLCVTNALSSRLTAEVRRAGVRWVQEYARGDALAPPAAAGPAAGSGTTIVFRPDADVFGAAQCSYAVLAERFRELAFLNRGLDMSLTDGRESDGPRSERFRFPGGAREFVAFLDAGAVAGVPADVIGFEREDPRMAGTVEVALRWRDSRDSRDSGEERVRSFANSRPTPGGGTHVAGFRVGVAAAVTAYARDRRLLTAADPDLGPDRIGEGLTAVVSAKLDRPEYLGATRGELGGAAVCACVEQAVREHLGTWLEAHPERGDAIVARLVRDARRQ
ncbi:DNA gyrase subunit B [Streptomyces sp. NPDC046876]|uniref:DNA gyrase subunit B n=1 Tax=Streptomyces sp. NPDC046876 TaxID=3155616 RepID=UPI0034114082